tara:strand:+ start:7288 stop:8592 length:1305 start_codon:yes stop_codon:yes gene_type:complete
MNEVNKAVLFVGQSFYHFWYLSKELRKLGVKADVLDIGGAPNKDFYHGQDFELHFGSLKDKTDNLKFFLKAICQYDVFQFANKGGLYFISDFDYFSRRKITYIENTIFKIIFWSIKKVCGTNPYRLCYLANKLGFSNSYKLLQKFAGLLPERWDIKLVKYFGVKVFYSMNGCTDGVSQTSFRKWETGTDKSVCDICSYSGNSKVCSDQGNLQWGKLRNELCDYIFHPGNNEADYNISEVVKAFPSINCLDENFWQPNMLIPTNYKINTKPDSIKIYHAVGDFDNRQTRGATIKSTHIYLPLIERLISEGFNIELIFFKDIPSKKIKYYQAQADIIVDMLSYGAFGANIREGLMLGKPCVCYLRPSWLTNMRKYNPEYVDEIPVLHADENSIYGILKDLILNKEKRFEIGKKSREFAVKWHSSRVAASKYLKYLN